MGWDLSSLFELGDIRAKAVAVVDTTGTQLAGFDQSRPATAALTNVASVTTSVVLAAANAARRGLIIVNDSTKVLYVAFAATASATAFTYKLGGGATVELPLNGYTGVVSGIWATANGNARITEITT